MNQDGKDTGDSLEALKKYQELIAEPRNGIAPFMLRTKESFFSGENNELEEEIKKNISVYWDMSQVETTSSAPGQIPSKGRGETNWVKKAILAILRSVFNKCKYAVPFLSAVCEEERKDRYLYLMMSEVEKRIYLDGYQWSASKFFEMKSLADKLEKEGIINIRWSKN